MRFISVQRIDLPSGVVVIQRLSVHPLQQSRFWNTKRQLPTSYG